MFDLRFLFVSGTFFLDAERLKVGALVASLKICDTRV